MELFDLIPHALQVTTEVTDPAKGRDFLGYNARSRRAYVRPWYGRGWTCVLLVERVYG